MDPKLISGVHVDIRLDADCNADTLSEVLNMLRELREYIEARPNVRYAHMEPLVELNGVFWEDGEPKRPHETKGVLYKLQENVKKEEADG
jgi:hypothetical protein